MMLIDFVLVDLGLKIIDLVYCLWVCVDVVGIVCNVGGVVVLCLGMMFVVDFVFEKWWLWEVFFDLILKVLW